MGTPLLTRTTRRVALTEAGAELLRYSTAILDDVAAASTAVRRIASGDGGTVRLGIPPPVAPTLAPYLRASFSEMAPAVEIVTAHCGCRACCRRWPTAVWTSPSPAGYSPKPTA